MKLTINGIEYKIYIEGVGEFLLIEIFEGSYKHHTFTIHYSDIDNLNEQIIDKIKVIKG